MTTVTTWIIEAMDCKPTEANIDTQIANQVNPPVVTSPLPWSQA